VIKATDQFPFLRGLNHRASGTTDHPFGGSRRTVSTTVNELRFVAACVAGAMLVGGGGGLASSPPRAGSQVVWVVPGRPVSFRLLGGDPDGDPITFYVTSGPSSGTISGQAPDLVYVPSAGFAGRDQLTYLVQDPSGAFDIGLVEFRYERHSSVIRVGLPTPETGADGLVESLAATLVQLGVRRWYVASIPTLRCVAGEVSPFFIGGWSDTPRFLAFGPQDEPRLVSVAWDGSARTLDVSALPVGSYLIVVILGTEAVSFPALVSPPREKAPLLLGSAAVGP